MPFRQQGIGRKPSHRARALGVAAAVIAALGGAAIPAFSAVADNAATADSLVVSPTSVQEGQTLTTSFQFVGADANLGDWIGFYAAGTHPDGDQNTSLPGTTTASARWDYINGDSTNEETTGTPLTSGALTFSTAGLTPGTYTVYLFRDDGYDIVDSNTITINAAAIATPGSLTGEQTAIKSGDPLSFDYTIPASEAASSNQVALFPGGSDPTSTKPLFVFHKAAPGTSGRVTFDTTGLQAGKYDAYLQNSSGALFQNTPVTVSVTGDSPQLPSPGQLAGQPNLVVNGGAEIGTGSLDGVALSTVPGWTTTGLMDEVQYDASDGDGVGGWPTFSTPGAADRGQNFFGGGGGGVSTATQTIDLSKAESQINSGKVRYNLGAWIGGVTNVTDTAQVDATFQSPSGRSLGRASLAPVTAQTRNDTTEFVPENATGTLPRGTSSVGVVITVNGNHPATRSGHGQGFVDNLSFTVSSDAVGAPAPPKPPMAHVPHFDHVFVLMMENEDYNEIIGNSAAPYINSLLPKASNLTSSFATAHPSDENYTALASGSTYTQEGNTQAAEVPDQQIGDLVGNAGGTWRAYMESANGPCDRGSQDTYTIDDTPFVNFKDLSDNQASCQEHEQPLTQMAIDLKQAGTTPEYVWFSANDCDDMEGCGITAGDTWISQTLPEIFNSPAWTHQRSLLIITWDEDANDAQANLERIPTLILGSQNTVRQGSTTNHRYTAYSLLRTIEAGLNLPSMTGNDEFADPINDIWTTSQGHAESHRHGR